MLDGECVFYSLVTFNLYGSYFDSKFICSAYYTPIFNRGGSADDPEPVRQNAVHHLDFNIRSVNN